MICNETLTAADEVIGPFVVPRDHFVQAFIQYGAGGVGTIALEITLNDTDWVIVGLTPIGGGAIVANLAAAGLAYADISAASQVRVRKTVAGGGDVLASLSMPAA